MEDGRVLDGDLLRAAPDARHHRLGGAPTAGPQGWGAPRLGGASVPGAPARTGGSASSDIGVEWGAFRRRGTETALPESFSVWDNENARQGIASTVWPPHRLSPDEQSFANHINVSCYVKYFDQSVLNYHAEGLVGPGVIHATCTSASVLAKSQLVRDVLLTALFSVCVLMVLVYTGGADEADTADFKALVGDFHTMCTFLLSFFVSTCLARWWAIRQDAIGKLWGSIDDISLIIGSYFSDNSEADGEVRERVLRWSVLSHELIYKQARAETGLQDLVGRGLLTECERQILEPLTSKPQVIWAWMCSYFAHLAYGDAARGGGRLPYPAMVLPQLHDLCRQARGAIGTAFAYTDTQVPFRYVHFLCLMVWVQNLIQAVTSAVVISVLLRQSQRELTARILIESMFLIFYPLLYLGLLHLGVGLLNPLRSSQDVDFPRGAFTYNMLAENDSFFKANLPPQGPPYGPPPVWRGGRH